MKHTDHGPTPDSIARARVAQLADRLAAGADPATGRVAVTDIERTIEDAERGFTTKKGLNMTMAKKAVWGSALILALAATASAQTRCVTTTGPPTSTGRDLITTCEDTSGDAAVMGRYYWNLDQAKRAKAEAKATAKALKAEDKAHEKIIKAEAKAAAQAKKSAGK
jgi:hypothetical protein